MSASGLQFIEFLLSVILVFQVELQTAISQHQCNNLSMPFPSCNNDNSVLKVTKSIEMYRVTLLATDWQCYNDFCVLKERNITCNDTCTACRQFLPSQYINGCNVDAATCEVWVDVYLDYFCAQAISDSMMNSSTISTSTTITTELPCPTSTITIHTAHLTTKTVSLTLPHQSNSTNPVISATPQTNNIQHHASSPTTDCKPVESYYIYPLVALGALQGLSLLLLAVVTAGWVCTCMSMKKKEAKISLTTHISRITDLTDGGDEEDRANEEQFFQNPTYDDTHMSTVIAQPYEIALQGAAESPLDENFPETTTYDSVNLPTQPPAADDDDDNNRQMYDVLNRSQANGGSKLVATEARRVHNNENYSQLHGLQEK